jgi:hypothetical protein
MFKAPPLELEPRVRVAEDFNPDVFEGDRLQR